MADNVTTAPASDRRPLSFIAAAGWTLAIQLVLMVSVQLTDELRPGARFDLVSVTTCYLLSNAVVFFLMVRVYEPSTPLRDVLAIRGCSIPGAILSAISGAGIFPAISTVEDFIKKRHPLSDEELDVLGRLTQTDTLVQRISIVVSFALVIPLCNELFFRGVLYGGLRRGRAPALAIFGTTIFFAASYFDVRVLPTMLALGLLLSLLRSRSGSVLPPVIASVAHCLVWVVPALKSSDDVTFSKGWVIGSAAVGLVAALGASALFSRDERALTARIAES